MKALLNPLDHHGIMVPRDFRDPHYTERCALQPMYNLCRLAGVLLCMVEMRPQGYGCIATLLQVSVSIFLRSLNANRIDVTFLLAGISHFFFFGYPNQV